MPFQNWKILEIMTFWGWKIGEFDIFGFFFSCKNRSKFMLKRDRGRLKNAASEFMDLKNLEILAFLDTENVREYDFFNLENF